jgi:hypothetical protein
MANEKVPKVPDLYECKKCDYTTSRLSQYERHLSTDKHYRLTNANEEPSEVPEFICSNCKKSYKHLPSLCKHKKKCIISNNVNVVINKDTPNNEIIEIMKTQMLENQELRKLLIEQHKQMIELASKNNTTTTNSNNTINNNSVNTNCNNSFNLQVFLNEKCKDALNMSEFIDTIKLQLSDLENFAQDGYAGGVSNIIVKGLNAIDTYLRPIHCSDLKRETVYIKDNDCWIKETEEKLVLKNAIKKVAFKNIKQINEWVKENPECKDPRTKKFDKYNKIVMNSMSGATEQEQHDNMDKIVRNVTKAVVIDKYIEK